ncbi:MAG TPA: hypothetical protein VGI57_11545 [Usitatibacter sp.]
MSSRLSGPRIAAIAAAAVLAAALLSKAVFAFPFQLGIDFYQFWGVPIAHRTAVAASPYLDPPGYERALNGLADASGNDKLKHANGFRRNLETMATPFFYSAFAFVPGDYETAQALYTFLLYVATGIAVMLLANLRGISFWPSLCLALLVELTFNPFVQDLKYGNVTSLQFLYMAVMLYIAVKGLYPKNALLESLYLGSLAIFVLFKPNTPWIALALASHYWVVRGTRKFAMGVAAGVVGSVIAFACGAAFFGDAGAWVDWFHFTQGMNGGSLVRTLEQGNLSPAMMLEQRSGALGLVQYALLITAWLALAFILAVTSIGRRTQMLVPAVRRCLEDPWLALSIGVMFTLGTAPLVWAYYHLFALIAIFAFFRPRTHPRRAILIALSYLGMTNPLLEFLGGAGFVPLIPIIMFWAWVPLLAVVLCECDDRALAMVPGDGQTRAGE